MRLPARILSFVADYSYAAYWTVRHLFGGTNTTQYQGGDGAPVLVLPGVFETWQFMRPIAERLHEAGHPVHVVPGFGHNRGTIPEMAALANHYIETNQLERVTIVAHSKGGLIGKHMMGVNDVDARIRSLIAINSPFGGSSYARFARSRELREFLPAADVIRLLAADEATNARITSIYSEFDPVIPNGSFLIGARNVKLAMGGHFRVLAAQRVFDEVIRAIPDE